MIEKNILNRIEKLEQLYPVADFDVEEYTNNIIEELESALGYKIKNRIKLSKKNYYDKDTIGREIVSFLAIDELRVIAYHNENSKKF